MARSAAVIFALAAAVAAAPVLAGTHSYKYTNFCQMPTLSLVGTAAKVEWSRVRLNGLKDGANEMGAFWHSQPMSGMRSVSATLTFQLHEFTDGGGDGFAVVLQTESQFALGSAASGLGYSGITGAGVAVEVDLFQNTDIGDRSNKEISVHVGSSSLSADETQSIGRTTFDAVRDGNTHTMTVTLTPSGSATTITVGMDGTTMVTGTIDAATTSSMNLAGKDVYLGVTGATGGRYNLFDMVSMAVSWTDSGPASSSCDEGFSGSSCEADSALSARECPMLSDCVICVQSHFCCGFVSDSSQCKDVTSGVGGTITDGDCPEQQLAEEAEKNKQAAIALGVLFGLVTLAFIISSAYWYRRVKRAEGRASMLGDMGEEYSKL